MHQQRIYRCTVCGAEIPDLRMPVLRHQLSHVERAGPARSNGPIPTRRRPRTSISSHDGLGTSAHLGVARVTAWPHVNLRLKAQAAASRFEPRPSGQAPHLSATGAGPPPIGEGDLLSRLHRKAETLDQACLRATGHPNDYAIRQELLSALEWDASLHPEHARPVIRNLFQEVYDHSTALLNRLRSADQSDGGPAPAIAEIHTLRERLAKLGQVLTAWKSESRAD